MKESKNYSLFVFIVIAVLAAGIPMIFFVEKNSNERVIAIQSIANAQDIIIGNVTVLRERSLDLITQTDILREIIIYEEAQIPIIQQRIIELNCTGVKSINGVTPEPVNKTFRIEGDLGINTVSVLPDTLLINATGLQTQYQDEQQSITTLFNMTMVTQMAIETLNMEVLKSVNGFVPASNVSNVDFSGLCGTTVYPLSNGTIAVDMCALIANATAAFEGVSFDLSQINMDLDQQLLEIQVVLNSTAITLGEAYELLSMTILSINGVPTQNNTFNLVPDRGFSIMNGTISNEISIRNEGLVDINAINTENNVNFTAGTGTLITVDAPQHKVTVTNQFAVQPCVASITDTGAVLNWAFDTASVWSPLVHSWGSQQLNPPGCVGTVVFRSDACGITPCGIFTMPPGQWILSVYMNLQFQDGNNVQSSIALRSLLYTIPFTSISFQQDVPNINFYYSYYTAEVTLSSLIIPAGTEFQLQVMTAGSPSASVIYISRWNMTRISQ